jgi:hypothetical protein
MNLLPAKLSQVSVCESMWTSPSERAACAQCLEDGIADGVIAGRGERHHAGFGDAQVERMDALNGSLEIEEVGKTYVTDISYPIEIKWIFPHRRMDGPYQRGSGCAPRGDRGEHRIGL